MRVGEVMEFEVDQVVTRQDHMGALGYARDERMFKSRPRASAQATVVQKRTLPPSVAAALKKPAVAAAVTAAPAAAAAPTATAPAVATEAAAATATAAAVAAPTGSLMDKVKQFTKEKPAVSAAIAVAAIAGVYFLFMRRPPSNRAPAMMPAMAGLGESHKPKRKKRRKSRKSKK